MTKHRRRFSLIFSSIEATPILVRTSSFLTLSLRVLPHIQRNMRISERIRKDEKIFTQETRRWRKSTVRLAKIIFLPLGRLFKVLKQVWWKGNADAASSQSFLPENFPSRLSLSVPKQVCPPVWKLLHRKTSTSNHTAPSSCGLCYKLDHEIDIGELFMAKQHDLTNQSLSGNLQFLWNMESGNW